MLGILSERKVTRCEMAALLSLYLFRETGVPSQSSVLLRKAPSCLAVPLTSSR